MLTVWILFGALWDMGWTWDGRGMDMVCLTNQSTRVRGMTRSVASMKICVSSWRSYNWLSKGARNYLRHTHVQICSDADNVLADDSELEVD